MGYVKRLAFGAVVALLVLLAACGGPEPVIKLSPSSLSLSVGASATLTADIVGVSASDLVWATTGGTLAANGATAALIAPTAAGQYEVTVHAASKPSVKATLPLEVHDSQATNTASSSIGTSGGTARLPSGAEARFAPGALTATTDVQLASHDTPPAQYIDGVSMAGERVVLSFPGSAVASAGSFTVYAPPDPAFAGSTTTMAEVSVHRPDGTDASILVPYIAQSISDATVTVELGWVRAVFASEGLPSTLTITVQPVDVPVDAATGTGLTTQSNTPEGLFHIGSVTSTEMQTACPDPEHQSLPPGVTRQQSASATTKIPLVMIHGWEAGAHEFAAAKRLGGTSPIRPDPQAQLSSGSGPIQYESGVCDWTDFITEYQQNPDLHTHFELFTFQYDSDRSVRDNASDFAAAIQRAFGGRNDVVLLAHSMGGLVANDAMHTGGINPNVQGVITLGTPFRGSPALVCEVALGGRCRYAIANPALASGNVKDALLVSIFNSSLTLLARQAGTKDLSWDSPGLGRIGNPYLQNFETAGDPVYKKFQAFYGDITNGGGSEWMYTTGAEMLANAGYRSDGIVPPESATLSIDNVARIATSYKKPTFDHNALHNSGDFLDAWGSVGIVNALLRYVTTPAPPPPNVPPTARLAVRPGVQIQVGGTITADASGSSDADGTIAGYQFTDGRGNHSTAGATWTPPAFANTGSYDICVVVTDDGGAADKTCQTVQVVKPAPQGPDLQLVQYAFPEISPTPTNLPTYGVDEGTGFTLDTTWTNAGDPVPDGTTFDFRIFRDGTTWKRHAITMSNGQPVGNRERFSGLGSTLAPGTYTVSMMIDSQNDVVETDESNNSRSFTLSVTNVAPTAAFTHSEQCLAVAFTDASTDPGGASDVVARHWAFGDGTTSTQTNPNHTYAGAGTYSVSLTVTDASGADSSPISHNVTVSACSVSLGVLIDGLPAGASPSGTITGPDGYSRALAGGTFPGLTPGDYTISAQQVNYGGTTYVPDPATQTVTLTSGAALTKTVVYTSQTPPPDVAPEILAATGPNDGSSGDTYTWSLTVRDADSAPSSITASVSVFTDGTGSTLLQEVPLTLKTTGGDLTTGVVYSGSAVLTATTSRRLYWRAFVDDGTAGVRYPTSGLASFQVLVASDAPPAAALSASPTSGTAPLSVHLDACASTDDHRIDSYAFDAGDGTTSTSGTCTFDHAYASPGTYHPSVTVTDSAGQTDAATAGTVVVNNAPGGPAPDLVLESPRIVPTNPKAGDEVQFCVTFHNAGDAPAVLPADGTIAVNRAYVDQDAGGAPSFTNWLWYVDIAAGYSFETCDVVFPSGTSTAGSHTVYAYIDADHEIAESNEGNNRLVFNFQVAP